MSFTGFDEFWLLICCGVPTIGAVGSTFVMTPWLDASALDAATSSILQSSKYSQAFIHAILGTEEEALYQWHCKGRWSKSTLSTEEQEGAYFSQSIKDPELWRDPGEWFQRQLERAVEEAKRKAPS